VQQTEFGTFGGFFLEDIHGNIGDLTINYYSVNGEGTLGQNFINYGYSDIITMLLSDNTMTFNEQI